MTNLPRALIASPHVRLHGRVDSDWIDRFLDQIGNVPEGADPIGIEVTTQGGDAEIGRRMVLEVDLAREQLGGRRLVFIGKTEVHSAGANFMSAFPREDRYLSADAVVLIHCRQLNKTVELSGPLRGSLPKLRAVQQEIETGLKLEQEGFQRLIEGSDISLEEVSERGLYNWYLTAEEALKRGLVAGLVGPKGQEAPSHVRAA